MHKVHESNAWFNAFSTHLPGLVGDNRDGQGLTIFIETPWYYAIKAS